MQKGKDNIKRLAGYLKKNPNDSFSRFALALELLKQNEVLKAQILFESILRQDPDYLGVYYHLGKLYEQTGRLRDAKEVYQQGMDLASKQDNQRARLELTDALELINIELDDE